MEEALIPAHELSGWDLFFSIGVVFVLMLFSAFFAGAETAMTAASRARMHQLDKDGSAPATHVNWLLAHREQMVGSMLFGNTFVNIASSALVTSVLLTLFGNAGIAAATLLTTLLVLIFCEVLPKTYAIARPDSTALRLGRAVRIAVTLFSPVVSVVAWIVAMILAAMGVKSRVS